MLKFAIVSSICSLLFILENSPIIIKTNQGEIRGKYWKTRRGRTFIGFTGIRYAEPPVGRLRFQAPICTKPWRGILDASKSHAVCPQINIYSKDRSIIGSEDCLFLNVYIPQLPKYNKELLPVMFYIHGGSFVLGSGRRDWIGPEILLDMDVILVTANYRLGALGFLSTGDEWAPGNNGLKDQSLAIKWVKKNIISFGGDSQKITVFGNSAGAACAHYHMISPLSRNLINRIIVQSGSAYGHYAISSTSTAARHTKTLGVLVNCSESSSEELILCLRNADVFDLIKQEAKFSMFDDDSTIPFRIVVEADRQGSFLIEDPLESIKAGKVSHIPLMTGIVLDEGAYKVAEINRVNGYSQIEDSSFGSFVELAFGIDANVEDVSKAIKTYYFGNNSISSYTQKELADLFTDGLFLWGLDTTVRLHFKYTKQPVYQYMFAYRGSTSYSTVLGGPSDGNCGVCHTDELLYLFSMPAIYPKYAPSYMDEKVSKILITLWTNFAKTGNPTPKLDSVVTLKWNPVQTERLEYYRIKNHKKIAMAKDMHVDRVKFWRKVPIRSSVVKH